MRFKYEDVAKQLLVMVRMAQPESALEGTIMLRSLVYMPNASVTTMDYLYYGYSPWRGLDMYGRLAHVDPASIKSSVRYVLGLNNVEPTSRRVGKVIAKLKVLCKETPDARQD